MNDSNPNDTSVKSTKVQDTGNTSNTSNTANKSLKLPSDADHTGRDLGTEELELLREAIESGHLCSTRGTMVPRLEAEFAARFGAAHACACANGSAAVHAAVAAIDPEPGDEIITTPITDMGALSTIIYQGAIPIFADTDPHSCNITPAAIEARLKHHARAIIFTHLFRQIFFNN